MKEIELFAGNQPTLFGLIVLALATWSLIWKGLALWRAAKLHSKGWFIALLIINTLGILEILYLYVVSKKAPTPDAGASSDKRA